MKFNESRLRFLIREALKSAGNADMTSSSSSNSNQSSSSSRTSTSSANQELKYDQAAVDRAKAAGLSDSEAGRPDTQWTFKFTVSGDKRTWHAKKSGVSWRNIGSDPNNATIKRLNAAYPMSQPGQGSSESEEDGENAAANAATQET